MRASLIAKNEAVSALAIIQRQSSIR